MRQINQSFETYAQGERVRLVRMDDVQAPPIGTLGTVIHCTEFGDWQQVGVKWDNGSSLAVAMPGDEIERVK